MIDMCGFICLQTPLGPDLGTMYPVYPPLTPPGSYNGLFKNLMGSVPLRHKTK